MKALHCFTAVLLLAGTVAHADTVDDRLKAYAAQGGKDFSAGAGKILWNEKHPSPRGGEARSCATCHTSDLTARGKHVETGKIIEPLSPAVNAKRLTDARQIEKWFTRNCKWVLGRECTASEKGSFLLFIRG
jgi:cytochrome c553